MLLCQISFVMSLGPRLYTSTSNLSQWSLQRRISRLCQAWVRWMGTDDHQNCVQGWYIENVDDVTLSGYIFALVEFATPHLREALMSWRPYKPDTLPNGDQEKLMMWTIGYKFLFVVCKLVCQYSMFTLGMLTTSMTVLRKWCSALPDHFAKVAHMVLRLGVACERISQLSHWLSGS